MKVFNFLSQVKQEFRKLVWPSRTEIAANLALVIIVATTLAIFLALVDLILIIIVSWLLG